MSKGSQPFFSLDISQARVMPKDSRHRNLAAHYLLGVKRGGRGGRGSHVKTIFVLDDDPDQAEVMAQALAGRGRKVRAFSDPIRALTALANEGADLLIADLSMPWIDGKDAVQSARLRRPHLPIILVSGYPRGAEIAAEQNVQFF